MNDVVNAARPSGDRTVMHVLYALHTVAWASFGALALIASSARGGGGQVAAGLMAAVFTTLGVIAILWGAAHVIVGIPLRRRRPWSRLVALMLGSVDVLLLPYGTALGAYAIWVLLRQDGKRLFTDGLKPQVSTLPT